MAGREAVAAPAEFQDDRAEAAAQEPPGDVFMPGESRVAEAARASLDGHRGRGLARLLPFLGPAFVASVAYIDPGNFAKNIAGGAQFGYALLWVVLAANLIGMLVQTQSAKLGIATGRNLPELCRQEFRRRTSLGLWAQGEIVAMATVSPVSSYTSTRNLTMPFAMSSASRFSWSTFSFTVNFTWMTMSTTCRTSSATCRASTATAM